MRTIGSIFLNFDLSSRRAGFLLVLLIGSSAPIYAQPSGQGGVSNTAPSSPIAESMDRRSRETALRSLRAQAERRPSEKIDSAVLKQLNEDFKRIQIIRLDLLRIIKEGRPVEYRRLADSAAEIGKRAVRIRAFLTAAEANSENANDLERVEFDHASIQKSVFDLCLEISRFVENPIFDSLSVYRARDAVEASNSLAQVISLSSNIKSSAEKLRRSK